MTKDKARGAPGRFLSALSRCFSAARLYERDHPSRQEARDEAHRQLASLLEGESRAVFSFLRDKVVFNDILLPGMQGWEWGRRLSDAGFQRMEFSPGLPAEEFDRFTDRLAAVFGPSPGFSDDADGEGADDVAARESRPLDPEDDSPFPHVAYGTVGLKAPRDPDEEPMDLGEETEALAWVHEMAEEKGEIPVGEVLMIVRSLNMAMHSARELLTPFLKLKATDQYTASHCINVSILSMSLAEELGWASARVRGIGASGLLHDVGKMKIPSDVLNKPGKLTPREREIIELHPVHGGKILMESGPDMAMPATVAYEHHMGYRGGGYPQTAYDRLPMSVSRLVQVCDFYDALRARRQYRSPLPSERVVSILQEEAGRQLDPEFVEAFVNMIRRWDPSKTLRENRPGGPDPDDRVGGAHVDDPEDAAPFT
ncbi:MAG: HD-GYP domain-containing protein [Gemmatimonadota bacterium]